MGTKKPQDHKTKAKKAKKTTAIDVKPITITVRGISATITRETLDDFDFMLDLAALESSDVEAKSVGLMGSVLLRLVGPVAARQLSRAGRAPGEKTSIEDGVKIIGEVFQALQEAGAVDPTGSPESSEISAIPS